MMKWESRTDSRTILYSVANFYFVQFKISCDKMSNAEGKSEQNEKCADIQRVMRLTYECKTVYFQYSYKEVGKY